MGSRAVVNFTKLSLMILLAVVVYNEFLAYSASVAHWPTVKPGDKGSQVRILLVADPQIQGYRDEPAGLMGHIYRQDSDRYLSKGFSWALSTYGPFQAIAFLGDLIDEGEFSRFTKKK